jgi:hypothetical protein
MIKGQQGESLGLLAADAGVSISRLSNQTPARESTYNIN